MLRQTQRTAIRPQTTAHLAQTMTLLELSTEELVQRIEKELASNPALEVTNEIRCPTCHRILHGNEPCPTCSKPKSPDPDQPIVFISPRTSITHQTITRTPDAPPLDEWGSKAVDLSTYVFSQIALDLEANEKEIANFILSELDEDGFLRTPIIEIALYFHKPLSKIEFILDKIKHSDPLGVGSASPMEALLVQLDGFDQEDDKIFLARKAIQEGLSLLGHHAYKDLGKLLNVSALRAKEIARFITDNLNPYPARAHWGNISGKNNTEINYIIPDIVIRKSDETPNSPLVVEIFSPYSGMLQINPLFEKVMKDSQSKSNRQWKSEYENAVLLVKCIQQRDHTIVRLIKRLVVIQREYILKGDAYLRPITRAKLAEELQVHESTISRAVSKKTIQLPNKKIIPISKLFDRSLPIRTALRTIIANEEKPLNDSQIAALLTKQGFPVARRTVAKYRSIEGILPARLRKFNQAANHK